jgi:hypothetical protein
VNEMRSLEQYCDEVYRDSNRCALGPYNRRGWLRVYAEDQLPGFSGLSVV